MAQDNQTKASNNEMLFEGQYFKRQQERSPVYMISGTFAAVLPGCASIAYITLQGFQNNKLGMNLLFSGLALSLFTFLVTVYAWIYFNEVMVYFPPSFLGGVFTYLLAFGLIVGPVCIAGYMANPARASGDYPFAQWIIFELPISGLWLLTCCIWWVRMVKFRRDDRRRGGTIINPMEAVTKWWPVYAGVYSLALIGIYNWSKQEHGLFSFPVNSANAGWVLLISLVIAGLAVNSPDRLTFKLLRLRRKMDDYFKEVEEANK
jgi:hypothetical protein